MQDITAIIDIGNGYIKSLILGEEDGRIAPLMKDIQRTEGLRKGKILDKDKLSEKITTTHEYFIRKLGGDFIDEVIVGLSHPEMEIERIEETKRVMSGIVGENDVNHLSKVMSEIAQKDNYEIIKILPVYWIVDNNKKEKDPIGLQTKKLSLVADVFRVPKTFYNILIEIFEKTGLHVIDMIPTILSSSEAILDFDQKDLGTLVIDIGTNTTSYAIFEEGYPLYFDILPIGSEDVTKDISIGMKVDIKEAENIKTTQGAILLPGEKKLDTELNSGFLSEIISARYEEIFDHINTKLKKLNKDGRLAGGVYLLGGGSNMQGLVEFTKQYFKLASFYAKENKLHLPDIGKKRQRINTLGLYTRNQQYGSQRGSSFTINFDIFNKIGKFFKDLF